jgi:hypothetical protein
MTKPEDIIKVMNDLIDEGRENDNLIIAWWDKETIEYYEDTQITKGEWLELCEYGQINMDWSRDAETIGYRLKEMRGDE